MMIYALIASGQQPEKMLYDVPAIVRALTQVCENYILCKSFAHHTSVPLVPLGCRSNVCPTNVVASYTTTPHARLLRLEGIAQ